MIKDSLTKFNYVAAIASAIFLYSAAPVLASSSVLIDIPNPTEIVGGTTFSADWEVDIPIDSTATCNITFQGEAAVLATFATSGGLTTGTASDLPAPTIQKNVDLSCTVTAANGTILTPADSTTHSLNPIVDFSIIYGSANNTLPPVDGVGIAWQAIYAATCSDVTRESLMTPGSPTPISASAYDSVRNGMSVSDRNDEQGDFQANPTESSRYSITCRNGITGAETTATIDILVTDPTIDSPIMFTQTAPTANPHTVVRDAATHIANVNFAFLANNADRCTDFKAYNIVDYPTTEKTLPLGFDDARDDSPVRSMYIELTESTIFTIRCERDERVFNGITYAGDSVNHVFRVDVVDPDGYIPLPLTPTSTTTPTLSLTPAYQEQAKIPRNTHVLFDAQLNATFVNACWYKYRTLSPGALSTSADYIIDPSWTVIRTHMHTALSQLLTSARSESSRLFVVCNNILYQNGTPAQQAVATVQAEADFVINETVEVLQPVQTNIYGGPSFVIESADLWALATSRDRVSQTAYDRIDDVIRVTSGESEGGITFTFTHPYGSGFTDLYDIHLLICDEIDGVAQYTITTSGGHMSTYTADNNWSGSDTCDRNTFDPAQLASGVSLTDGDTITISCQVNNGDECNFAQVFFGALDSGAPIATVDDTAQPSHNLLWVSSNAVRCYRFNADPKGGSTYGWFDRHTLQGVKARFGFYQALNRADTGQTEFTVECMQRIPGGNVNLEDSLVSFIATTPVPPVVPDVVLADGISITPGNCRLDATGAAILPTDPLYAQHTQMPPVLVGRLTDAFPGARDAAVPFTTAVCVPLVDLFVNSGYLLPTNDDVTRSDDGVDNVNGTSDVRVVARVHNEAAVALPANTRMPYQISLVADDGLFNMSFPDGGVPDTFSESLPATMIANDAVPFFDENITALQFGSYTLSGELNYDTDPDPAVTERYPEQGAGYTNNAFNQSITIPLPTPHITLNTLNSTSTSASKVINTAATNTVPATILRSGNTFDIEWSINVNYDMRCELIAPGISPQTITILGGTNPLGMNPHTGTLPITVERTSEFQIRCTEAFGQPLSTPLTYTGRIEVVPELQEL
jgi:hypothetical protein